MVVNHVCDPTVWIDSSSMSPFEQASKPPKVQCPFELYTVASLQKLAAQPAAHPLLFEGNMAVAQTTDIRGTGGFYNILNAMRDEFNQDTKLILAHRANLTCSNPDCGATTGGPQLDPSKALNIGVAAHITAAAPGGARYDESLTPEQRGSSENGIWLCQNCAKLVDNDSTAYPTEVVRAWKTIREHNAFRSIGQTAPRANETEAQRKSKKILEWKDKHVMLVKLPDSQSAIRIGSRPWSGSRVSILKCNEFFIQVKGDGWDRSRSVPMDKLKVGWDGTQDCLEILEYD